MSVALSQNKWTVLTVEDTIVWKVPGTGVELRLRAGHAGFILVVLALWFHEVIEPINRVRDDWGWAPRKIRGSATAVSNHASGTAIDLNATQHPLGISGTFKKAGQRAKIIAKMIAFGRVIRWGGEYHGRKDEMHFEVNASADRVLKLATRLAKTARGQAVIKANPSYRPAIVHLPGTRNLSVGDHGADVQFVQRKVGVPVDGNYGESTAKAVKVWERAKKTQYPSLVVDGKVGKNTWASFGVKVKY